MFDNSAESYVLGAILGVGFKSIVLVNSAQALFDLISYNSIKLLT